MVAAAVPLLQCAAIAAMLLHIQDHRAITKDVYRI